jgi:peptidoglycan/LPS O-acetylase OafA/YrhL
VSSGAEKMEHTDNFDFLRIVAASVVIVGHAYPINGEPYPSILNTPLSVYGVMFFFSISGYLVSQSWVNDPEPVRFFLKRCLRIFPALVAVVLLSVFVLGPLVTTLSAHEYFTNGSTYFYLRNVALNIIYNLPGVFEHAPIALATNGSLWSLPAECLMYLVTPAVMLIAGRIKPLAFFVLSVCMACAAVYIQVDYKGQRLVMYGTEVRAALAMGAYFAGGALLAVSRSIPLRTEYAVFASFIYVLGAILPTGPYQAYISATLSSLTIPYVWIVAGRHSTQLLNSAGKRGDLSYGLYLYAFPIQQTLRYEFPAMPLIAQIALTFALTIPCAALSWHFIERTALKFKPRSAPLITSHAVSK